MRATHCETLREEIAHALNTGKRPSAVADELHCSRATVYKVLRLMETPEATLADGRHASKGRPRLYAQDVWQLILDTRRDNPHMGPMMLYHTILRNAEQHGIQEADLPSPSSIALAIRKAGLATKPVGPGSRRTFPAEALTGPGTLTLDTWGPWHLRGTRVYLITVQDRFTRLAVAYPVMGRPNASYGELLQLTAQSWARAIEVARRYIVPEGRIERLYADNGVGFAPAFGNIPAGARHALAIGAQVIFIPPAEPWRNGRLERYHWSQEREYWRRERPATQDDALRGLTDYANWFNTARPHAALGYKAPADLAPWYKELPPRYWEVEVPEYEDPVPGQVTAIRLVHNNGLIELWTNEAMQISPVLAGQYVRVEFTVTGFPSTGRVVYNRKRGEDIVVATFNHSLDAPRRRGRRLVTDVCLVDFDDSRVQRNVLLDAEQVEAQRERVLKRARGGRSASRRDSEGAQADPGAV